MRHQRGAIESLIRLFEETAGTFQEIREREKKLGRLEETGADREIIESERSFIEILYSLLRGGNNKEK